jgi:hypothetical protein
VNGNRLQQKEYLAAEVLKKNVKGLSAPGSGGMRRQVQEYLILPEAFTFFSAAGGGSLTSKVALQASIFGPGEDR